MKAEVIREINDLCIRISQLDEAATAVSRTRSVAFKEMLRPGLVTDCLIAERNLCVEKINVLTGAASRR